MTQDVTSEDLVTLYRTTLNSSGLKMRGNLRSKNAELIEKVRTSYEIQNKQTNSALILCLPSSLLAASIPAFAVTGDTDQPIHIESDQQSLDMQGNVVTFTGNVIVTQGTIKINADKVVVTVPGGEQGKEVIDGYGKPATFYQMQQR